LRFRSLASTTPNDRVFTGWIPSIGGPQFWTKLEKELDKLADPRMDLPAEKKAKILSQIRTISDRWRPFLLEAASAIDQDAMPARDGPTR
jgi:hypothetical protein